MAQLADNHALLIYRVGPVLCCTPTLSIETLIAPPSLTHPPGSSDARPGIFRHDGKLVSLIDVRQLFGVEKPDRNPSGRIVICHPGNQYTGFLVDEVIDVIDTPASGWGPLPASLSGGVFNRSLLLAGKIHLYCEFEKLSMIRSTGVLKPWIQQLHEQARRKENASTPAATRVDSIDSTEKKTVPAKTATETSTISRPPAVPDFRSPPSSVPPVKQHNVHRHDDTANKMPPVSKHAHAKNTPKTENKKQPPPAPLNPMRPAMPPFRASSVSASPKTPRPSSSRLPIAHPATDTPADNISMPTNNVRTPLQIMMFVLISAGLISTLVYLWPDHNTNPATETEATIDTLATETQIAAEPTPYRAENTSHPIIDKHTHKAVLGDRTGNTDTMPASSHDAPDKENHYHATISQQIKKHGTNEITIVVTVPAHDQPVGPDVSHHKKNAQPPTKPSPLSPTSATSTIPANKREKQQHKPVARQRITEIVHIVVKGDTLWHIAQRYIHNPFRYPELARLNKIRDPNLIYPGDRVRIIRIYQ